MNNPSVTNDYVPPEYLIKSDDTSIYSMPPTYISNIVTFRHKSFYLDTVFQQVISTPALIALKPFAYRHLTVVLTVCL